ncbi:hypothetical protein V1504DRAFT_447675, partial [Lipomyces starkeyi]
MLCTATSRSALELVHTEVVQKVYHQEENGTIDKCSCTVWSRYLLPCSHKIPLGLPLEVTQIHPHWRVQISLPDLNVPRHNLEPSVLSGLKDPEVL